MALDFRLHGRALIGEIRDAEIIVGKVQRCSGAKLPARVVTFPTMELCLFADDDYAEPLGLAHHPATALTTLRPLWQCALPVV